MIDVTNKGDFISINMVQQGLFFKPFMVHDHVLNSTIWIILASILFRIIKINYYLHCQGLNPGPHW